MNRVYVVLALALAVVGMTLVFSPAALAQSGHFVGKPACADGGTFLDCSGKVASLVGTTFRIDVSASGVADVTCTNPGGEVAAGQSFTFEATGSTGDQPAPTKRKSPFRVSTNAPSAPHGSCPNEIWEARVTEVHFTTATLTLFGDGIVSDTITVRVS